MNKKTNLIYLLGAGRSGTTLLTAILNNHDDIEALGEMHQFFEFIENHKNCSCGIKLRNCKEWNLSDQFLNNLSSSNKEVTEKEERHFNILKLLFSKSYNKRYLNMQEQTFSEIHLKKERKWYVDSSKYIARYLLLKKSKQLNLKGIYLVRDPRGVVHSFNKKVQTSKAPLSALLYYNIINLLAEIVRRKDNTILKIRYEDLVEKPELTLSQIYSYIFEQTIEIKHLPDYIKMPHIIGGNRMKTKKKIKIKPDKKWKKLKRNNQIIYYILSLPFVILNKYKI